MTLANQDGCRPDQLFGLWAIEETRFRRMVDLAKAVDLAALRAESVAAADRAASQPLYRTGADGIARIDISGPMTKYPTSFQALLSGTSTLRAREALRAAARDPEVAGILVVIDSPGGTVAGTSDLAAEIRRADAKKPVYTYAEDLAASAALWTLVQGRKAYANQTAEIGSIGAYWVVEDTSQVYAQEGVKVHVISSAPPIKGAGVDGTEVTPAQLAEWERRVKDVADVFASEVASGRGLTQEQVSHLATGAVWVADKARKLGLIDGVMGLDEVMAQLRSEAMKEQDAQTALALAEEAQATAEKEKAARAEVEKQLAEVNEKLAKIQAKERGERFAKEVGEIGAVATFASVLDAVEAKCGETVYGALMTQLRAFAAQVKEGALFKEKGASGADTDAADPAAQLRAIANGLLQKGEAKDFYSSYALACERNPKLVEQAGNKEV
jgi:signal peptide peptidase SppA